jgi:tetratricopeptide (TPR) repeat protein
VAAHHRDAGRHVEAERELNRALAIARERNIDDDISSLTNDLARSRYDLADYAKARELLTRALGDGSGPNKIEIRIRLGMVAIRLADMASADAHLRRAAADLEAGGDRDLVPLLNTALGELAYESGNSAEARTRFERSAALWTDDTPDAASVEARAYLGLLDGPNAKRDGEALLTQSIEHARTMHRVLLEARARVFLARLHIDRRRFDDAVQVLSAIPDDAEQRIGPELQAQARYWRGVAFSGQGKTDAAQAEAGHARQLVMDIQASLPEPDRARYAARADIRRIIG